MKNNYCGSPGKYLDLLFKTAIEAAREVLLPKDLLFPTVLFHDGTGFGAIPCRRLHSQDEAVEFRNLARLICLAMRAEATVVSIKMASSDINSTAPRLMAQVKPHEYLLLQGESQDLKRDLVFPIQCTSTGEFVRLGDPQVFDGPQIAQAGFHPLLPLQPPSRAQQQAAKEQLEQLLIRRR